MAVPLSFRYKAMSSISVTFRFACASGVLVLALALSHEASAKQPGKLRRGDPPKVMLVVMASPNMPKPADEFLGATSGVRAKEAVKDFADAFEKFSWLFDVVVTTDTANARKLAEKAGMSASFVVTILKRRCLDGLLPCNHRETTAVCEFFYYDGRLWKKASEQRFTATGPSDPFPPKGLEGLGHVATDTNKIRGQMGKWIGDTWMTNFVPIRVKTTQLGGAAKSITVEIANHTKKVITKINLGIPVGWRVVDGRKIPKTAILTATDPIAPSARKEVTFTVTTVPVPTKSACRNARIDSVVFGTP